jgi:hypothetical protein
MGATDSIASLVEVMLQALESTFFSVALISGVALLPSVALFFLAVTFSTISRPISMVNPLICSAPDPSSTREATCSSFVEAVRLCLDFGYVLVLCSAIAISIAFFDSSLVVESESESLHT